VSRRKKTLAPVLLVVINWVLEEYPYVSPPGRRFLRLPVIAVVRNFSGHNVQGAKHPWGETSKERKLRNSLKGTSRAVVPL